MLMRLVSFFVLSLFSHAAALVYPVSFGGRGRSEIIQVKILPMEQEGSDARGDGERGMPPRSGALKSNRATAPAVESRVEAKSPTHREPPGLSADATATVADNDRAAVSQLAHSGESVGAAIAEPTGSDGQDGLGGSLGGTGNGSGSSAIGFGRGSGNGNGVGSWPMGIALTHARYRDTPRPNYPDSARREGREGRVLLRVLVDDQGRSKKVEINSSSGSEALDRAAVEAIKRWRFHPARYGDSPVESWLRVPIEFHLAEAKSR